MVLIIFSNSRVIFIEDFDMLCKNVKSQLWLEMDKLEISSKNNVMVILTTSNLCNSYDNHQYDMIISIKEPDTEGRKSILRYYLNQIKHSDQIDIDRLALMTTGRFYHSFPQNLVVCQKSKFWRRIEILV